MRSLYNYYSKRLHQSSFFVGLSRVGGDSMPTEVLVSLMIYSLQSIWLNNDVARLEYGRARIEELGESKR